MGQSPSLQLVIGTLLAVLRAYRVPRDVAVDFVERVVVTAWARGVTGDQAARVLQHAVQEALVCYPAGEFWEALRPGRYLDGAPYRAGLLACVKTTIETHLQLFGPDAELLPDSECPFPERLARYRSVLEITAGVRPRRIPDRGEQSPAR